NSADADNFPFAANAPATINVGMTGIGRPICCMSTFANTTARPYWAIKASICHPAKNWSNLRFHRSGLRAVAGQGLLLGEPVGGVGHAVHAPPSFSRCTIETFERAGRQRQRAPMSVCFLSHIAQ